VANLVWLVLVVLLVVLLLGVVSSVRRSSVAGGETVSTGERLRSGLLLGIIVFVALVILAFGNFQWNWFGP